MVSAKRSTRNEWGHRHGHPEHSSHTNPTTGTQGAGHQNKAGKEEAIRAPPQECPHPDPGSSPEVCDPTGTSTLISSHTFLLNVLLTSSPYNASGGPTTFFLPRHHKPWTAHHAALSSSMAFSLKNRLRHLVRPAASPTSSLHPHPQPPGYLPAPVSCHLLTAQLSSEAPCALSHPALLLGKQQLSFRSSISPMAAALARKSSAEKAAAHWPATQLGAEGKSATEVTAEWAAGSEEGLGGSAGQTPGSPGLASQCGTCRVRAGGRGGRVCGGRGV